MDNNVIRRAAGDMLGIDTSGAKITQYVSREDGEPYNAWEIALRNEKYVLKKAKGHELEVYSTFFVSGIHGAPRFYGSLEIEGEVFILIGHADGRDLSVCDRESLVKTLDALISIQESFWNDTERALAGYSFDKARKQRITRGQYLGDSELESFYAQFLDEFDALPRTLCHDDLLPFNVIASDTGACLIDWEYAGVLPYLSPLARLIAHAEESEDAFFRMSRADRDFAIDYYFDNLVSRHGIDRTAYEHSLDLFLLYEYCEWIMLGNRYADADMNRYAEYLKKAKSLIEKLK